MPQRIACTFELAKMRYIFNFLNAVCTMVFIGTIQAHFQEWFAAQQAGFSKVMILTDAHVHAHCLPLFLEKSGLPPETPVLQIPAGEAHKTLQTAGWVWEKMLEARLDKKALLINLGGGVVSDLGGFCAALWKRGMRVVNVPTTLLAMVDAAIGGKTGVDMHYVKNIIGTFHNPLAVFVDSDFLQTLPLHEKRSGFGEMIKHAFLASDTLLIKAMYEGAGSFLPLDAANLANSISVKTDVIAVDPLETKGIRHLLNFGHTFGHAFESCLMESGRPVSHGEAVVAGMLCEAFIGYKKGHIPLEQVMRLHAICTSNNLYPQLPLQKDDADPLWRLMQQDKKNAHSEVMVCYPDVSFSYEKGEKPPNFFPPLHVSVDRALMQAALDFYFECYRPGFSGQALNA